MSRMPQHISPADRIREWRKNASQDAQYMPMWDYYDTVARVLEQGLTKPNRTDTMARSIFGAQMRFEMTSFPLLTSKYTNFDAIAHELLWFISGSTHIADLPSRIWDQWATEGGELGPIYGHQWRKWPGRDGRVIDQLERLVTGLKKNPNSRRHIVSAWNVDDLPDERFTPQANVEQGRMALAPCHTLMQFYVAGDEWLDCQVYQRSADMFLGVPFNIASYALLLHMVGAVTRLKPRCLIHTLGDAHLYTNHIELAQEMLERRPLGCPQLHILPAGRACSLDEIRREHLHLEGYESHPAMKAKVAV